jgi:predicted dehydrogenase
VSITIGIVGAGAIGRVHAESARDMGLKIGCIADILPEKAKQLAGDVGGVPSVDSAEKLYADTSIDGVVIGAPNIDHKTLAIAAMRAGKDVLLEKPMGMSAAECREINAVAKETGRVLQIGYVQRFSTVGQGAKKLIDTGSLGKIYHAKAQLVRRRGIPGLGGWFTTKAQSGGGPLIDVGVHVIDLALYLMGGRKPTRVSGKAYSNFGSPIEDYVYEYMWAGPPKHEGVFDVEDEAHAMIHFDDGATLSVDVAWAVNAPSSTVSGNQMAFFGDKGGLTFELFSNHLNLASELNERNADSKLYLPETDAHRDQFKDFVRAVENRTPPCATGEQGEVVQSVIDAVYESSDTSREVALK